MAYINLDRSFYCFVTIHACDRQIDGRTDRILIARPRLHSMQRGKNATELSSTANIQIGTTSFLYKISTQILRV